MQFLTKLIKGILGFITGLLKPKKDAFFLEYEGDAAPAEATQKAATSAPAAAPAPAPVAQAAPAAKVAAPVAASTAAALNLPAPVVTFAEIASDPTSGPSTSRRRPGANMASFLNMASQASVPVR